MDIISRISPYVRRVAISAGAVPVYWWRHKRWMRNFGDELAPMIVHRLARKCVVRVPTIYKGHHFVTVGSVLGHCSSNSIVWGSGIIAIDERLPEPAYVAAVRGPISRDALMRRGVRCPSVFGDPALLLPRLYSLRPSPRYEVGLVPHFADYPMLVGRVQPDIKLIDVGKPAKSVIRDIISCRCIVSSSLHGIIVAHAYGIPAARCTFGGITGGDGIKFDDYFAGVGLRPAPPAQLEAGQIRSADLISLVRDRSQQPLFKSDLLIATAPFISN